jgi:CheY-like chemotaxis protein
LLAGRKLLIADDSPYYRTVIGLTFTDEGMEITTAGHGRQALELIDQSTPDVILASVSMPEISGYELCRLIKQSERWAHIPVMLLVGSHEHFDPAEARRVGADDVVTKPFKSIRQLVGRVGSLLGGKADDEEDAGHGYSTLGLDRSERYAPSESPEHSETGTEADPAANVEEDHVTDANVLVSPANEPAVPDEHNMSDVKVFVEAPLMAENEPIEPAPEPAGSTCPADIELQTADTQRLERIDDEPEPEARIDDEPEPEARIDDEPEPEARIDYAQADTLEMPAFREGGRASRETGPAVADRWPLAQREDSLEATADVAVATDGSPIGTREMNEQPASQTATLPTPAGFNEGLLDLGDFDDRSQVAVDEDLVLDLDYEEPANISVTPEIIPEAVSETPSAFAAVAPAEAVVPEPGIAIEPWSTHEEQPAAELQEWAIIAEAPAAAVPVSPGEDEKPTEPDQALSPAMIDAIARRAVELLSEKVVREIAWEVVPELAELMIRRKLEEQK